MGAEKFLSSKPVEKKVLTLSPGAGLLILFPLGEILRWNDTPSARFVFPAPERPWLCG